jgi:hypothetical protein
LSERDRGVEVFENLRIWWTCKSGKEKVITVLAVVLILQIGLCFSTPALMPWVAAVFHIRHGNNPLDDLGPMVVQMFLCIGTIVFLIIEAVFGTPGLSSDKNDGERDGDE